MRLTVIATLMMFVMVTCTWAKDAKVDGASNAVWQAEFMGRENTVLQLERYFVPGVQICGGVPDDPALEVLMTVIHYDGIGKQPVNNRLRYWQMGIEWEEMAKRAEWIKGESLDGAERDALQKLYARYAGRHAEGMPWMKKGNTMFTGQAELMKRYVFGSRFDVPSAVKNLEEKNGWRMDCERYETPSFELLARALNKRSVPVMTPHTTTRSKKGILFALGACSNKVGQYVVLVNPVDCGLGQKSYFDKITSNGGTEWGMVLAPPGAAHWNSMQDAKRHMWPAELVVSLTSELPKGCVVVPYDGKDWDMTVVKNMRPVWDPWLGEIEKLVVTNTAATNAVIVPKLQADMPEAALWSRGFMGKESFAVGDFQDLISGLRCCPAGAGLDSFAGAFATVVFRSHPDGVKLVEKGYDWRRVVLFTCEERWRIMAEAEKKALHDKFFAIACNMPIDVICQYNNGERLWSLDAEGAKELRAIFAAATNGVALGPIVPVAGKTVYQQAVERLLPFDKADSVKSAMARIADRYGWGATVEQADAPSFAVMKKAIEMEIPVLVNRSGNGGWAVAVGFLVEGGEQYVLLVDPEQVKPDPRAEDVSQEEHEGRMALRADLPGRIKYVKSLGKSKFVVDQLLDTKRELPEGCHFVKMSSKPLATAYFIHDWKPTICSKEKVAELVARTKPVDGPDYKK